MNLLRSPLSDKLKNYFLLKLADKPSFHLTDKYQQCRSEVPDWNKFETDQSDKWVLCAMSASHVYPSLVQGLLTGASARLSDEESQPFSDFQLHVPGCSPAQSRRSAT